MASIDTLFVTKVYRAEMTGAKAESRNAELEAACLSIAEDDEAGQRWCAKHGYPGYTSYASLNDLPWRVPVFGDLLKELDKHVTAFAKELEAQAGRVEGPRWGPRPLDVDLLLVGELQRDDAALTLPHPRLRERGFVLAPLADVAPELRLPPGHPDHPDGRTAAELLAALPREAWPVRVPWTADEHGS